MKFRSDQRLIGDLAVTEARPGIILGAAPSLPEDLKRLPSELLMRATVISANEIGHQYHPAHLIASADDYHQRAGQDMWNFMPQFGVPTVSPGFWADYRVADVSPRVRLNGGTFAMYVAACMGLHPIIVCGVEHYTGGTYWNDPGAFTTASKHPEVYFRGIVESIAGVLKKSSVRPVSGPLTKDFPAWPKPPGKRPRPLTTEPGILVKWTGSKQVFWRTMVERGTTVRLSVAEYRRHCAKCAPLDAVKDP